MSQRYFEDLKAGDWFKSVTYQVSEEEIINFAREFDPQPFHLDAAVADQTMFKGLIASGWHTAAITMRLFVQTLNFAEGAIGLGVDEFVGRMQCDPAIGCKSRPRLSIFACRDRSRVMGLCVYAMSL